jgi:hypothetical protein
MNEQDEYGDALGEAFTMLFALAGKAAAYELYLTSLANTLVELNPELREPFKENFLSVADLQRKMIHSDLTREHFDETVKSLISYFELMKGGGFFDTPG